jgi:hypothetical protein
MIGFSHPATLAPVKWGAKDSGPPKEMATPKSMYNVEYTSEFEMARCYGTDDGTVYRVCGSVLVGSRLHFDDRSTPRFTSTTQATAPA